MYRDVEGRDTSAGWSAVPDHASRARPRGDRSHLRGAADQRATTERYVAHGGGRSSPPIGRRARWARPTRANPGRVPVLEQLQRRTAPGGDEADPPGPDGADRRPPRCHPRRRRCSPRRSHHRTGNSFGADTQSGVLEHSHRSVPQNGAGAGDDLGVGGECGRPMSRPCQPEGTSSPTIRTSPPERHIRTRHPVPRATMSVGRRIGLPEASRAAQSRSSRDPPSRPRPRDRPRLEGEADTAAHHQNIHPLEQGLEDAEFVGNLRAPPRRRTVGRARRAVLRVPRSPVGAGTRRHWASEWAPDHRRMAATSDAEGVVDIGVVAINQFLDELRVVPSSPGSNRRFSISSTWEQAGQLITHRSEVEPGVRRPQGGPGGCRP